MTIIEGLYDFWSACPLLTDNKINVDYLPETAKRDGVEFSIDATPGTEILNQYIDGGAQCQYLFVLRSVNDYGPDVWQNIANSGFYDGVVQWMADCTRRRNLPPMPEKMTPRMIEAMSTAYLFGVGAQTGKYQIQCRLVYFRKGDR